MCYNAFFQNLPQLLIQILSLILFYSIAESISLESTNTNIRDSNLLITIFSMLFTIISIILSGFDYCLKSKFVYVSSSIIISFCVESNDVANMPHTQFKSQIVNRKNKLCNNIAKILSLRFQQVERLTPKLVSNGIIYVFIIAADETKYDSIHESIQNANDNDKIKTLFENIYGLKVSHINSLRADKLQHLLNLYKMNSKVVVNKLSIAERITSAWIELTQNVRQANILRYENQPSGSVSLQDHENDYLLMTETT